VSGIWRLEEDGCRLGTKADLEDTNSAGHFLGIEGPGPCRNIIKKKNI
jgi:hypothetical protein